MPVARRSLEDRFWPRVDKSGECWMWTAARSSNGYGEIGRGGHNGGMRTVHRVAYELTYGLIPPGLEVLHHCDTKLCVRPSHLFLGTQADNNADMIAKGRFYPGCHQGERNGRAKLVASQVRDIKEDYSAGFNIEQLAESYCLSSRQVSRIVKGKHWRHLEAGSTMDERAQGRANER